MLTLLIYEFHCHSFKITRIVFVTYYGSFLSCEPKNENKEPTTAIYHNGLLVSFAMK